MKGFLLLIYTQHHEHFVISWRSEPEVTICSTTLILHFWGCHLTLA